MCIYLFLKTLYNIFKDIVLGGIVLKIEKITENKIRIVLKQEDLKDPSLDLHTIMTKAAESQGLFLEILEQAKKQCGFDIDGHKLLIEAFSSTDDFMVFTITKFAQKEDDVFLGSTTHKSMRIRKKFPVVSPSYHSSRTDFSIYRFDDFEQYCSFCSALHSHAQFRTRGLVHFSSLYAYKGAYYLVLNGYNFRHDSYLLFASLLCEFGAFCTHSIDFEHRLKEYGKCIMKKNAISTTFKFFE